MKKSKNEKWATVNSWNVATQITSLEEVDKLLKMQNSSSWHLMKLQLNSIIMRFLSVGENKSKLC